MRPDQATSPLFEAQDNFVFDEADLRCQREGFPIWTIAGLRRRTFSQRQSRPDRFNGHAPAQILPTQDV